MAFATLAFPLDPVLTDADWEQDFAFFLGPVGDERTPDGPWSGDGATLALLRRGGPPDYGFVLDSTSHGGLVLSAPNTWTIRAPAAQLAAVLPGVYDAELRRLGADGAVEALATCQVYIYAGLSGSSESPANPPAAPAGGRGGIKIFRTPSAATAVAGGAGPRGQALGRVCRRITAAAYTLGPADDGYNLLFTAAAPVTVTVPAGLPAGFQCLLGPIAAAADLTVLSAAGVALQAPRRRRRITVPWAEATLRQIAPDQYVLADATDVSARDAGPPLLLLL